MNLKLTTVLFQNYYYYVAHSTPLHIFICLDKMYFSSKALVKTLCRISMIDQKPQDQIFAVSYFKLKINGNIDPMIIVRTFNLWHLIGTGDIFRLNVITFILYKWINYILRSFLTCHAYALSLCYCLNILISIQTH